MEREKEERKSERESEREEESGRSIIGIAFFVSDEEKFPSLLRSSDATQALSFPHP